MISDRQPLAAQKASSSSCWRTQIVLLVMTGDAGVADRRHVLVAEAKDLAYVVIAGAAPAAPVGDQFAGFFPGVQSLDINAQHLRRLPSPPPPTLFFLQDRHCAVAERHAVFLAFITDQQRQFASAACRSMGLVTARRETRHRPMHAKARHHSPTCIRDRHFGPHPSPRIGLTGRAGAKEGTGDRLSWGVL